MWLNLSQIEPLLSTDFIGRRLIYLTSTGSTQDVARSEAEAGETDKKREAAIAFHRTTFLLVLARRLLRCSH